MALKWDRKHYCGGRGVLIASDENQEWLLKWWWENYSKYNSYPVTFFDFGMSKSALSWCEQQGKVISFSLPEGSIKDKNQISVKRIQSWTDVYQGDPFPKRKVWFYKPCAFLQSPFDQNIWIDLDCEVRKSIEPLFDYANYGDGFGVVKLEFDNHVVHNSGVLVFKQGSPVIEKWARKVQEKNHEYLGDENALIDLIYQGNFSVSFFPLLYNWPSVEAFSEFLDLRDNSIFRRELFMESTGNLNKSCRARLINSVEKEIEQQIKKFRKSLFIDQSSEAAIVHHLSDPGKTKILARL